MERLHKVLSTAGYGSRRELERMIADGKITVNGVTATVGAAIGAEDRIMLNGRPIKNPLRTVVAKTRILLYHKPTGEICSRSDPKHDKTVFDNLPRMHNGRWIQVGRLDINTSGLMVFTNDGELANQLMHPSRAFEREYAVRVFGKVEPDAINNLLAGVTLEDGEARFDKIYFKGGDGANSWYHVILHEGRNREVRRLWQSQGVNVSRLIRVRFGPFQLPRYLARGKMLELSESAVTRAKRTILEYN